MNISNIFILEDCPERIKQFNRRLIGNNIFIYDRVDHAIYSIIDKMMSGNKIDTFFLDHDLGGEQYVSSDQFNTGTTFVKFLCQEHIRQFIGTETQIIIHSLNGPARDIMESYLLNAGYSNITKFPFAWTKI